LKPHARATKFRASSSFLASTCCDKTIKLWNLATAKCIKTLVGHNGHVRCAKYLGNDLIAACDSDGAIKMWDLSNDSCVFTLQAHTANVSDLELNNNILISGSCDKTIKCWDLGSSELEFAINTDEQVCHLKLLGKNSLACAYRNSGKIGVWDLDARKCIYELKGHKGSVHAFILPDEDILASCGEDETIRIWDLKKKACVKVIENIGSAATSIALQEGNVLACGCENGKIYLFGLPSGDLMHTLNEHTDLIGCLIEFAPGKLISGSRDKAIKIWDIETSSCDHTLIGHDHTVTSFLLSYS
jgi:WD40 repeat protein